MVFRELRFWNSQLSLLLSSLLTYFCWSLIAFTIKRTFSRKLVFSCIFHSRKNITILPYVLQWISCHALRYCLISSPFNEIGYVGLSSFRFRVFCSRTMQLKSSSTLWEHFKFTRIKRSKAYTHLSFQYSFLWHESRLNWWIDPFMVKKINIKAKSEFRPFIDLRF